MNILFKIYLVFMKIGLLSFGGGYAIFPSLEAELCRKRRWLEKDALLDLFGLSQSLPGVLAVNVSIYAGYMAAGIWGAFCAVLGVVTLPMLFILLIAVFFQGLADLPVVVSVFHGVNIAVVVLILQALYTMVKWGLIDKVTWLVFFVALALYVVFSLHPIFLVLGGILFGLWFQRRKPT